ncbi:hypothetical protein O6H91_14G072700 [Diphasiastrum complanatum]|uniref:Uncharacterized protein n=1 Tax=Diphasiastrum complanatum TaxID=34168 RepID=A0ACC2BQS9_DIPCM|nr:hypothetical protein O6H91_Y082500 [Diphasiastrum complanatum]KAJ7532111.1 hypothetical protein O6H91_14G072700 [Diphasiastrum complanatum]
MPSTSTQLVFIISFSFYITAALAQYGGSGGSSTGTTPSLPVPQAPTRAGTVPGAAFYSTPSPLVIVACTLLGFLISYTFPVRH